MTLGRQRLALMLDSLTQPGRRIDRSQTFSDHPHRPVSFIRNNIYKYTYYFKLYTLKYIAKMIFRTRSMMIETK